MASGRAGGVGGGGTPGRKDGHSRGCRSRRCSDWGGTPADMCLGKTLVSAEGAWMEKEEAPDRSGSPEQLSPGGRGLWEGSGEAGAMAHVTGGARRG